MEAKGRFSSRRPSRYPLHGRNDMKTSKKRFSRQKHAHKQRKTRPFMSSCAATIATTVSRTTDTLHCFNGLQQPQRPHRPKEPEEPQRPHRPKEPEEPQRPQGWMLSFDSHPPTFREEPIFRLFYALNLQSKSLRKLKNSIFRQTKRKKP